MRARRRSLAIAAAGLLGLGALAAACDALLPPDMTRAELRSVVVADAQHQILRAFTTPDGKWRLPVRAAEVDARYLALLRGYEDRRFDRHVGVDPLALLRAASQWAASGRIVSGGSTLTMQTARLLEPRPRGVAAKIAQIVRALQIEERYGKDDILSMYLTLAPFGGNLEGVRAAALAYFGKEPTRLTLGEAALLVALPQSPERLRPDRHPEAARHGRDKVLARMRDAGIVTASEAAEAMAEKLPQTRLAMPFSAPHLAAHLAAGAMPGAAIDTGIYTTLQLRVETLTRGEARWFADSASVAAIVVENRGRTIRAYVGGVDFFGKTGQVDLARSRRSPGSALKPFIYGMAFDEGIAHPASLIDDEPSRFGDYAPHDFDQGYRGTVSVREALAQSLNVPAVSLLDRIGPMRFIAGLRHVGARVTGLANGPTLPVALGGLGISLADLTMLYAGLADGGNVLPLSVAAGEPAEPRRLMSATSAWYVTDILAGSALPDGWAQGKGLTRSRAISFKTGTSYGFRDAWAVGYSRSYTVGVWVGRADGSPRPAQYGRNTAAPVMLKLFDLLPAEEPRYEPPPADAFAVTSNAALPPALRRFSREPLANGTGVKAPRILFPPEGALIEWNSRDDAERGIALKAEGGRAPLLWVVNGRPLVPSPFAADSFWRPDGAGFARIAVTDADGHSTAIQIRVESGD